ncbi:MULTISPECIES: NAD(P)H-dependent glycerol-3-phosphate dehydrogenase [Halocynthiibacter]|uniref:Glycerol-3-phosphate dehydrogenase [NAD(P)+] n=1 Tax=Halocynthiibacter halioticoli TaxID=2986804 RepID=A0AAE3LSC3_9RHOB|nr:MULTISPECIES: NAD(P)H-dependent glycerol-3-phosphate dehydrogenase [Halocynthiibacter]MCV6825643.1 NAD(P)-dependent glycerol-3-phosphate dehydrogenase [Halocynthiibacter halioticoli]MCW4058644.1 NAD(P)-dependent glycerol-3-phosphate dehydrogenase [Halocynthiibacter sp. SDUM655004]
MSIAVLGSGAFGTALAITLASAHDNVTLWARDENAANEMARIRENKRRLSGAKFPPSLNVSSSLAESCEAETLLIAIPTQLMDAFLRQNAALFQHKTLVACCKGVNIESGLGPTGTINKLVPTATAAILTGPSFAVDIAGGLPTALTLAGPEDRLADLQEQLSTPTLRLYRTTDVIGAELGGALKNVIAIASGAAIGAGFGESARAAVMTRGYAEMLRLANALGAKPATLSGLSGFGDLTLTCTSEKSRNYRYGLALGAGAGFDETTTVEGAKTAKAVSILAQKHQIDMPITNAITEVLNENLTVSEAVKALLSRPLKEE